VAIETTALATVELRHPRHELHRSLSDEQQRWLTDLYRKNASAVDAVCRSVLRNSDDAADATQEVFLRAIDALKEASSAESARSWLLTVARSYSLDVLHSRQRLQETGAHLEVDAGSDADPEAAAIQRHIVTAIFGELREPERRALWQWAVERRPLAAIAHDQGRSYKAVQQFLIRTRHHALVVAARVAALLGLFQLGRAVRRASQAGQLVLVAITVPMVLASLPSSGADRAAAAPPSHSALLSATGATGTSGTTGPTGPPGPVSPVVHVGSGHISGQNPGISTTVDNTASCFANPTPPVGSSPKALGGGGTVTVQGALPGTDDSGKVQITQSIPDSASPGATPTGWKVVGATDAALANPGETFTVTAYVVCTQ
jgi:RNA polymerase sigma factor (sigma-70 family)